MRKHDASDGYSQCDTFDDLVATLEFAAEVLGRQTKFYRDSILARLLIDIEATLAKVAKPVGPEIADKPFLSSPPR